MPQTRVHKPEDLPQSDLTLPPATEALAPVGGRPANAIVPASDAHPLAHLADKYSEEPLWDDFLQAMQEVRCRMNAQEETTE